MYIDKDQCAPEKAELWCECISLSAKKGPPNPLNKEFGGPDGPSDPRKTSKSPHFKGFFEALRATDVQRTLSQNYLTLFEKILVKFVLPFSVTGN